MKLRQFVPRAARRHPLLVAAGLLLVGASGRAATTHADQPAKSGTAVLAEDAAKLAIVVMANQTAVTQTDAVAVLAVLEKTQAQLDAAHEAGGRPDDTAAAALDTELRGALSPALLNAVDAVRLLAPAGPGGHPRGGPGLDGMAPPPDGTQPPPPPEGGSMGGGRRAHRGGGPGGPFGMQLLGPLTEFFRTTAGS